MKGSQNVGEPVVIVTGLGRCGTSLVMQMLSAASFPMDLGSGWPAYENPRAVDCPISSEWMRSLAGRAVKIIDPLKFQLPEKINYKIIFLRREETEQAKSQMKLLNVIIGIPIHRTSVRALAKANRQDTVRTRHMLTKLSGRDFLELQFEEIIGKPFAVASKIAEFVGLSDQAEVMARVVIPRTSGCLDYLLEIHQLMALPEHEARAGGR